MRLPNWLRPRSTSYRIEVVKSNGVWFWRLLHTNGKTLAHSENYSSKTEAVATAAHLADAARFPLEIE